MMALDRGGYGMGWLCLSAVERGEVEGVNFLDLSGCTLSARRIFFVLDRLPKSVEGLKLGSCAVKGPALPLFRRFLEGVGGDGETSGEGGGERLRLKSLNFGNAAFGPSEAKVFCSVLPSSLETLILKGNPLDVRGARGLAERIKEGKLSSVLHLDLEKTGLDFEGLKILCGGMEGKSLKVETLNLSSNRFNGKRDMEKLCSVLCAASLPEIRVLLLKDCLLPDDALQHLAEHLEKGNVPKLETLSLEMNDHCNGLYLGPLGRALRGGAVPRLRGLHLNSQFTNSAPAALNDFLMVLRDNAAECPSDLHVKLVLSLSRYACFLGSGTVRSIGAGRIPALSTLDLYLCNNRVRILFEKIAAATRPPRFESLDLSLNLPLSNDSELAKEAVRSLVEPLNMGRLNSVRKLEIHCLAQTDELLQERKTAVLTALSSKSLPLLSELILEYMFTDIGVEVFAAGIRDGNLSGLRKLSLSGESVKEGKLEDIINGIIESERGLPFLEKLSLSKWEGGWTLLGRAVVSGKLGGKLSHVSLRDHSLTDEFVRDLARAVRGGLLSELFFFDLSEPAGSDVRAETWGEFLQAMRENEKGMPKLKTVLLCQTGANQAGGAVAFLLSSGKVPSLENFVLYTIQDPPDDQFVWMDAEGLGVLVEAVRSGEFPPMMPLSNLRFRLREEAAGTNVDGLITAIFESEKGLLPFVWALDLSGGRMEMGALGALAARAVGNSGGKLSRLNSLSLRDCNVDDDMLRCWGSLLSAHVCPQLECIDLRGNRIMAQGASAFIKVLTPQTFPQLKYLLLREQKLWCLRPRTGA
uniref:Uncharacterized protein n=1 Tax=Chromera velia CCMP2878 TaxID=1169474 RepID=A0A0G4GVK8_9ALVE|eukprot:Cvel_23583.t1-p1 / transcript=Cvel_23583.t1 / gene=Cvel_23583 / organism=Chromera_velia_CCMP2878 / gene_product=hypothetical protein / transcript_product=hypothetical protein / location=Cvel_scaffold2448:8576-10999(-) / protein_length=808 / sequence_SO=supercontig / SO=protein_coding / is_pseudo=false